MKTKTMNKITISLLLCLMLSACATLDPDYEKPTVVMSSFRAVPGSGAIPTFEIGLRVINPNPQPMKLEGVVYSISLQGHELVKGVGKGYPPVEGYGEQNITLSASANLLRGVRFITTMVQNKNAQLEYEFKAKLDVGGPFPSLKVAETGTFNINN